MFFCFEKVIAVVTGTAALVIGVVAGLCTACYCFKGKRVSHKSRKNKNFLLNDTFTEICSAADGRTWD
jgi:MFS superfamily sulfate permease-like transporter